MPTKTRRARAMSDQWMQYVRGRVLESAANTFTQTTVNMPVVVGQAYVVEMYSLEIQTPTLATSEISATDDITTQTCQLTKSSQTALLTLDNPDLIAMFARDVRTPAARTAEKAPVFAYDYAGGLNQVFPEPILLPFEQIYFGARTEQGAAAGTYYFRIGFKTVRLATNQLVELLQAVT